VPSKFKFTELGALVDWPRPGTPKVSVLEPVTQRFIKGVARITGITFVPVYTAIIAQGSAKAQMKACEKVVGTDDPDLALYQSKSSEIAKERREIMSKLQAHDQASDPNWSVRGAMGFQAFDNFAIAGDELVELGIIGIYHYIIVQACAVFETLADDLLRATKEMHPQHATDLGNLSTPERIRTVFREVFSEEQINKAAADPAIDTITACRDVIVNNAGWVDDDFVERAKEIETLSHFKKDALFAPNGHALVGLVQPVVSTCTNLLAAVDTWLDTHKA